MRSLFRNVFLAVVAALALTAVATASASAALPELVNSKGAELVKKKFTGEVSGGEPASLETLKHGGERCGALSFAGEVKGTKGGEATLTLLNCGSCHTKGAKENEIKLSVSASLVWLSKAKESIALLLSIPGVVDLEGFCWGSSFSSLHPLELSGSFLVSGLQKNTLRTEYASYARQTESRQEIREYENETGAKVKAELETKSSKWKTEPVGIEAGIPMKFEEEAEFKA